MVNSAGELLTGNEFDNVDVRLVLGKRDNLFVRVKVPNLCSAVFKRNNNTKLTVNATANVIRNNSRKFDSVTVDTYNRPYRGFCKCNAFSSIGLLFSQASLLFATLLF